MALSSSRGEKKPRLPIAASKASCVMNIQPRRRPSNGKWKRSINGDQTNFHVYGKPTSANRPMAFKSTCSAFSHADSRLYSMNSGSPDVKPSITQVSILRLK